MPVDSTTQVHAGDHLVHFFDDDDDLVRAVVPFVQAGLRVGQPAIVIATPEHRRRFLAGMGDVVGRIDLLDAEATLSRFLVDDRPDPALFHAVVGDKVRAAARSGTVRAFGEMVALLWEAGNVIAALELEHLWNEVCAEVDVALLCAYPWRAVGEAAADFADVCQAHSHVVGGAPVEPDAEVSRRLPRNVDAARLARRFVDDVLRSWGRPDLVDRAALVATELATNAIRHARSDVTISLLRVDGVVRVSVGDADPAPPRPRDATPVDQGGRGLHLVRASATAWGHRRLAGGKVVWADLGS